MYTEKAVQFVKTLKGIVDKVQAGGGFSMVFGLAQELWQASTLFEFVKGLDAPGRAQFFGEVFDQCIGTEEGALITEIGFLSGQPLEIVSDGVKAGFVAFMEEKFAEAA